MVPSDGKKFLWRFWGLREEAVCGLVRLASCKYIRKEQLSVLNSCSDPMMARTPVRFRLYIEKWTEIQFT
jgi:hypothetical protein